MAQDPMNPLVVENDAGDRLAWNGQTWTPLGNKNAPGSAYLSAAPSKPDKSEAAYFNAYRKADDPSINSARSGIGRARRMEGLLQRQETGGIYSIPVVGSVAGWFDPEIREMDAIQSEVARGKRTPGEGAISDFDAKQFLAMTYGKDKPTATNRALIQAQRLADDAALQRRQFMEWHYNTYGKASGATEAWDRYAQDNPIFDPTSETQGSPVLNGGRKNWRQYFGVERSAGDARGTQAQEDVTRAATPAPYGRSKAQPQGWTKSLPPRQLAAAKMFAGSKEPSGSQRNPFVPRGMSEFNAIPTGAWVLDDDGTVFQKGKR